MKETCFPLHAVSEIILISLAKKHFIHCMLIALVNSFRTSQPFGKNLVISENSTSEVEKEMAFTLNEADCGH